MFVKSDLRSQLLRAALVTVLVFSFVIAGCKRAPQVEGVDGMAAMVPSKTLAYFGGDFRTSPHWKQFMKGWGMVDESPELKAKVEQFKRQIGMEPKDLIASVEPAGWMAVLDPKGGSKVQDLALVGALVVRDQKHAEACFTQLADKKEPKEAKIGEATVKTYPQGFSVCFDSGFVYIGSSVAALESVVGYQGESLAQRADFKEARQKVHGGAADAFGFVPLQELVKFSGGADSGDWSSLNFLAFGVKPGDVTQPVATMSVKSDESALSKALLTKPESSPSLARTVPQDWSFYLATHLGYQFHLVAELCRMGPEGKEFLADFDSDLKGSGTSVEELDAAFSGSMALALETSGYFTRIPETPPNGMLVFGLKDVETFNKVWKAFCATAEVEVTREKRKDLVVDVLDSNFLLAQRTGSEPMAMLVFGSDPSAVLETVTTIPAGQSLAEVKPLSIEEKPENVFTICYDLRQTMKELLNSGLLGVVPDLRPIHDGISTWPNEAWQGHLTVRVAEDGLRIEGAPVTMAITGIMSASMAYAFTEEP